MFVHMSQLSGGVSVDRGYRVRYAGGSGSADAARPARRGDGEGSLGPEWGSEEWNLPGQGESGPGCGEWYPDSVCESCGEPQMATRSCGRRSCPECFGIWAKEAAVRGAVRIQAFRYTQPDDWNRQVAHAYWSPGDGEVMNERQYWQAKKKAAEIAKEKGFRGFAVIPHPYRVTDEGQKAYREEVPRGDDGEPVYGIWVWLRNDVEDMQRYIYWSPHYHIIGFTSADMDPGTESDEGVYQFKRSLESFDGIRDRESHEDVYGLFRYLLSHTGFPKGSTRQVTTWHGALANNKFVEKASESWQHEKPSEGVLSALEREIEEVAGPTEDASDGATAPSEVDDKGECPVDGCGGVLIDVFDVGAYLRQANPPPGVQERMKIARDWRLGRKEPPPGMKCPQSEEQAREAFEAFL